MTWKGVWPWPRLEDFFVPSFQRFGVPSSYVNIHSLEQTNFWCYDSFLSPFSCLLG